MFGGDDFIAVVLRYHHEELSKKMIERIDQLS
jgi:hypothetical protein